jgi:hypothetical protein
MRIYFALMLLLSVLPVLAESPQPYSSSLDGDPLAVNNTQLRPTHAKRQVDFAQWTLVSVDAAMRGLDIYSTRRMLECSCNHEKFLPDWVSQSTPALVGLEGATVIGNYALGKFLERHHHSRLARLVPAIDAVQVAPWSIHNLFLPSH